VLRSRKTKLRIARNENHTAKRTAASRSHIDSRDSLPGAAACLPPRNLAAVAMVMRDEDGKGVGGGGGVVVWEAQAAVNDGGRFSLMCDGAGTRNSVCAAVANRKV